MKQALNIWFEDFWNGFEPKNNYFWHLLSEDFQLNLTENCDLLIYSCYGKRHLDFNCFRLFYAAENTRPDFYTCDFAISFDYIDNPRHYRLPLYALYIDRITKLDSLTVQPERKEAEKIWASKTKFCCMVVSNEGPKERIEFFKKLNEIMPVDSGGMVLNNVGGPVDDKMKFISDYRFVIAFENSSFPGYTTEKIIEPLIAHSIPLYWGDPNVTNEINSNRFLEIKDLRQTDQFIEKILEINGNPETAINMLTRPIFVENRIPESIDKTSLRKFINKIVSEIGNKKPVAQTWKSYISRFKVRKKEFFEHLELYLEKFK